MKKTKQTQNRIDLILVMALGFILLLVTYLMCGAYYRLNDDVLIRDYISGIYSGSPSGHTMYLLYPFEIVLMGLYSILPFAPWYGIAMLGLQLWCFILIGRRLLKLQETRLQTLLTFIAIILLYLVFFMKQFIFLHYSVTGGLLMMTACFLFLTCEDKNNNKEFLKINIIPIILSVLCFSIRPELGLLLLPLLAAGGVLKYSVSSGKSRQKGAFWKKYAPIFLIAVVTMGIFFAADQSMYRSEGWKEHQKFHLTRIELYDYNKIPSYESNKEYYDQNGISKMQVELLQSYNYMLDESVDASTLQKVIDYNNEIREPLASRLKLTAWLYVHRVFGADDRPFNYIIIGLYAVAVILLLCSGRVKAILSLLLMVFVRSGLWGYLLYRGRMTDRVLEPLMFTEIMILTGLIISVINYKKWAIKIPLLLVTVLILIFSAIMIVPEVKSEAKRYEDNAVTWMNLQENLLGNKGDFYIVDVYSSVQYSERVFDESRIHRLCKEAGGEEAGRNNEIAGGWHAFSPLMYEKHAVYGFSDAYTALLKNDGVYFVSKSNRPVDWLVDLYRCNGVTVSCNETGRVDDFIIYKVVQKK